MNRSSVLRWALALLAAGLWLAGAIPAWRLWQSHEAQLQSLAQQRQSMQTARQQVLTLQAKAPMAALEAQSQIVALAQQHLSTTPKSNPDQSLSLTLQNVAPAKLSQLWTDIRQQTSASVTRADLTLGPQGWTGTLVLQLAKLP